MKGIENHYSEDKDKSKATIVPPLGNCVQIRRTRLERIAQEKMEKTKWLRKRTRRQLKMED